MRQLWQNERIIDYFPLSSHQISLWILDQLQPGSAFYHNVVGMRLRGSLNVAILERSIRQVVARQASLRTRFTSNHDEPVQFVPPEVQLFLPVDDLGEMPPEERETRAVDLAAAEGRRPFNMTDEPPFRVRLLRLGQDDHVLVLTFHHIACDAWSVILFLREMMGLYGAFLKGLPPDLPELPLQYRDYAIWQRHRLEVRGEEDLAYWVSQLTDAPQFLDLPTDRLRPPAQTYRGAIERFSLPLATTQALKELSRAERSTLFMTMLAGFQALLHRYTGQEDVLVGTPVMARTRPEFDGLIGFFLNTLVMRGRFAGDPTFRELLRDTRRAVAGGFSHLDLPFDRLVEALRPSRDLSHHPIFQVMLAFQQTLQHATATLSMPGVSIELMPLETHTSRFDLTLCIFDSPSGLDGVIEYSTDLFEATTIANLGARLTMLLDAVVADPGQRISRLPIITEAERHSIVTEWAGTNRAQPDGRCIHDLFQSQADRTPDAVAVIDRGRRLTYAELNGRANQLAHRLVGLGVKPESVVGLCTDRSAEMVVGLLAIMKAGGAIVAMRPDDGMNRLGFLVEDLGVRCILTEPHLVPRLPIGHAELVEFGGSWSYHPDDGSDANLPSRATARNLAYAIYTSGSTGAPKATGIEHVSAVSFLHWARRTIRPEHLSRTLATTSPAFDCFLLEVLAPLACGAAVMLADSILELPALENVTLVSTVPAAMAGLLRGNGIPDSVKRVHISGDVLSGEVVRGLYQSTHVAEVYNFYGPSEATTYSTGVVCNDEQDVDGLLHKPSIGRPIDNVQVYVLDRELSPVPVGVTGELCIGGAGLARGYLNRPALTAERFVPNPFAETPGARMYRTGDLARWNAAGELEFVGRADTQVKLRGFRVEPGEVEAVMSRDPSIQQAVVLVREDRPGDQRLVAYVVPAPGEIVEPRRLRDRVADVLPAYMVPSAFVSIGAIPLTATGKADMRALPVATSTGLADEVPWRISEATELQLVDLMCEVLGIDDMEQTDNFFDLGGHSLLATMLISRVEACFGIRVPLASFLGAPTAEGLALVIRDAGTKASPSCLVRISGSAEQGPFFCVHPGGAEVYRLSGLRRALGERPVYGVLSIGFNGAERPAISIEEMAAHYIAEIAAVQPKGPYRLGGYSVGGLVAFEMARQLSQQGSRVGFLALFDSMPPPVADADSEIEGQGSPSLSVDQILRFDGLDSVGSDLPSIRSLRAELGGRRAYDLIGLSALLDAMKPLLAGVLDELKARGHVIPDMDVQEFYRLREIWANYLWAAASYRAKPYPGPATLYVSDDGAKRASSSPWRQLVTELHIRAAGERHGLLFMSQELGRLLNADLDDAEIGVRGA